MALRDNLNELTDDEDFVELIRIVVFPRQPQRFQIRSENFLKWNDEEFRQRFRFTKQVVHHLIEEIFDLIASRTSRNHALSPEEMIFATLRFLATGSFLQVVGDMTGIHKSTASRAIHKVLRAIASLAPHYIKMPTTQEEIDSTRQGFYNIAKFPRCVGAIDCTHIKIQSPGGEEAENYRNRKSFFSFNVQAVCNSNLEFTNVVCRWPGSTHDSTIFNNSMLRHGMENNNFGNDSLLVGDSGYGIRNYLITPLRNPITQAEHLFNESQIRTRNPIERGFGVLKRRFPILALGIRLHVDKVEAIVVATVVLHNLARKMNDVQPLPLNDEVENAILLNNVPLQNGGRAANNLNNATRHSLINDYFETLVD